jgi:ketosteroid isomerase-like protein
MSQENAEIVRRMYAAFHAGDAEGALAYFDPDVEVDASMRVDVGIVRGRDALYAMVARWVGAWEEWREEIEEIRELGSQVLVVTVQHGRSKESDLDVATRYAVLYEIQGNQIIPIASTPNPRKPSRPPGWRSRRCRRRTWSWSGRSTNRPIAAARRKRWAR